MKRTTVLAGLALATSALGGCDEFKAGFEQGMAEGKAKAEAERAAKGRAGRSACPRRGGDAREGARPGYVMGKPGRHSRTVRTGRRPWGGPVALWTWTLPGDPSRFPATGAPVGSNFKSSTTAFTPIWPCAARLWRRAEGRWRRRRARWARATGF